MKALRTLVFIIATAAAAAGALAAPGEVLLNIPSPESNPLGMTYDGSSLWVIDRLTDRIYRVNPVDGAVTDSLPTPRFDPTGLAWDGRLLWCVDGDERATYAINPATKKLERSIALDMARPSGVAWDGKSLWVADEGRRKLHQVDVKKGTIARSIPAPSQTMCGMTFDGKYLWVADRHRDQIYMVSPDRGDVVITLRSPGPHPWGLAWDGNSLWNVDYQTDRIYKLVVDDGTLFSRYDGKAEQVELVHQVRNFGPEKLSSLQVTMAIPENRDTQELLDTVSFGLAPARIAKDRWGQQVAIWQFKDVPAESFTDIRMSVPARIFSTRYFVYPEKVGTLSQIPRDIRINYLADESWYATSDPVILNALKQVVGNEKNPYWMARKIYNYVIDRLTYELAGGWSKAPEVLKRGTGSCSEYSFVFVSMCRAAGIPARLAGSVVIRDDDASYDNVFHRWAEIYLPNYGWIPVDPSGGDSPRPSDRADNFGYLDNRYLITTVGGGASDLLAWSYNAGERWTAKGTPQVAVESFAEWSPLSIETLASDVETPVGATAQPVNTAQ